MKRFLSLLLFAIPIHAAISQEATALEIHGASDRELAGWVERYMADAQKFDHFSGVVLIARGDRRIFGRAYGMANYELNVPNTLETRFRIGSVSKTFTAAAVAKLHQQGRIDLDRTICAYLKDCPSQWGPITVRQLLSHTSGLVNFTSLPEAKGSFLTLPHTHEEIIGLFRNRPLESAPGEKYSYNNSAYYLLGVIVENVSGLPLDKYLQDTFFTPLKMVGTGDDAGQGLVAGRASGYRQAGDGGIANTYYIDMTNSFAIGGLHSTAEDLLLWGQAFDSTLLFDRPVLDEIFTPARNSDYGLGWALGPVGDCSHAYHDGGITDFSASLQRITSRGITIVAISNRGNDGGIKVAYDIAGRICGAPATVRGIQEQMQVLSRDEQFRLVEKARGKFPRFRINEALVDEIAKDLSSRGKLQQAIEVHGLNTLLYPQSANAYLRLGEAYMSAGDRAGAEASFRKCLELDPSDVRAAAFLHEVVTGAGKKQ